MHIIDQAHNKHSKTYNLNKVLKVFGGREGGVRGEEGGWRECGSDEGWVTDIFS